MEDTPLMILKLDMLRRRGAAKKVIESVSEVPMDEEVIIDIGYSVCLQVLLPRTV